MLPSAVELSGMAESGCRDGGTGSPLAARLSQDTLAQLFMCYSTPQSNYMAGGDGKCRDSSVGNSLYRAAITMSRPSGCPSAVYPYFLRPVRAQWPSNLIPSSRSIFVPEARVTDALLLPDQLPEGRA